MSNLETLENYKFLHPGTSFQSQEPRSISRCKTAFTLLKHRHFKNTDTLKHVLTDEGTKKMVIGWIAFRSALEIHNMNVNCRIATQLLYHLRSYAIKIVDDPPLTANELKTLTEQNKKRRKLKNWIYEKLSTAKKSGKKWGKAIQLFFMKHLFIHC